MPTEPGTGFPGPGATLGQTGTSPTEQASTPGRSTTAHGRTGAALADLLAGIERHLPAAIELRRRLHETPEPAHAEHATAALIASELPVAGDVAAGTGRLALIGAREDAPAPVAVRAELDGVPVREQTGAPFSATGEWMHGCGHDVHMAALVALARAAHELRDALPAPLLAVFQPSEEAHPSGAEMLLREGALGAGGPPSAVVAAHVHPELAWGEVALDAGAVNASCDTFEIAVLGAPAHGAYPHEGRDPILALAELTIALHARAGRVVDPLHPASVSIGVLQAGTAENVLPERALARGALRAHRGEDRETLRRVLEEVVAGVCAAHGCRGEIALQRGEPALVNDARIVAAARELLGEAGLRAGEPWRSCGSDDFAFFSELAPIAMAFVGLAGAPGFTPRPLHHPELLVGEEAVGAIARVQAVLYCAAAGHAQR